MPRGIVCGAIDAAGADVVVSAQNQPIMNSRVEEKEDEVRRAKLNVRRK